MKKFLTILLLIIFFFWSFQEIFADECSSESIYNYFKSSSDLSDEEENDLENYINEKNFSVLKTSTQKKNISDDSSLSEIEKLNENFIESQNQKFEIAIKYVLKKYSYESENKWWEEKYLELLNSFKKKWDNEDFFINNFLTKKNKDKKIINKNPKNIPTPVLQKSVYLDFLIFSCELWKFKNWKEFTPWGLISNILSESGSTDFEKKEILEKQKIVVAKAVSKYQGFITNREMYIALRWVVKKLEHLKWRFEDFARLIWFLPAKIVDFWYEWQ